MKYLGGSFQAGGYSKAYADQYDRIFGKKEKTAPREHKSKFTMLDPESDRTTCDASDCWCREETR